MFDDSVYDARDLGRDGGVSLAAEMGVVSILGDVAFELVTEAGGPFEKAVWPAIRSVRRNRALPYLEIPLWPRNMPDCTVARSMPQNIRDCR